MGLVGQYTSSSIGIDGLGVISYYDSSGSNLDLKVAHCIDVACSAATSTTVDSPGTVGWYTSLAIGADGLPLVTYRDVGGDRGEGRALPERLLRRVPPPALSTVQDGGTIAVQLERRQQEQVFRPRRQRRLGLLLRGR